MFHWHIVQVLTFYLRLFNFGNTCFLPETFCDPNVTKNFKTKNLNNNIKLKSIEHVIHVMHIWFLHKYQKFVEAHRTLIVCGKDTNCDCWTERVPSFSRFSLCQLVLIRYSVSWPHIGILTGLAGLFTLLLCLDYHAITLEEISFMCCLPSRRSQQTFNFVTSLRVSIPRIYSQQQYSPDCPGQGRLAS